MITRPVGQLNLPSQCSVITISEDQIRNLRATPVTAFPTIPGFLIVPYLGIVNRKVGTAYGGGGGITSYRIKYPAYGTISSLWPQGFTVGIENIAIIGPPNLALLNQTILYGAGPGQGVGEEIQFTHNGGAELTGGSGTLRVTIFANLIQFPTAI